MGKQYYCDFCDKSFGDNANNRKNHLKGLHHQRLRRLHYDSFRDPSIILAEEKAKKPCVHFQQDGSCSFGASCRFSHLTAEEFEELEQRVIAQREKVGKKKFRYASSPVPKVEEWLAKRKVKAEDPEETKCSENTLLPVYHLPISFSHISNLPASVLPPMPDALDGLPLEAWG